MKIKVFNNFKKRWLWVIGKSRRVYVKGPNKEKTYKKGEKEEFTFESGQSIEIRPKPSPTIYPKKYWIIYPEYFKYKKDLIFHPLENSDYPVPNNDKAFSNNRRILVIVGKRKPEWWIEIKHPNKLLPNNNDSGNVRVGDGNQNRYS